MNKILFLEDEEVLGRIYRKRLERAGYEVRWTKSVKATEEALKDFAPDAVILDHGIHDEERGGVELLPTLKKMAPHSRLIMLSNYSLYDLQEEALKMGADDYLVKINTPPEVLIAFLNRLKER